ncbi:MAG: hypothetical protein JO302_04495 [Candidatus Eremiobacteraeota bacterium]|nr:hypothetical protein [Candidatus Eremiobacteraeota bacterium]
MHSQRRVLRIPIVEQLRVLSWVAAKPGEYAQMLQRNYPTPSPSFQRLAFHYLPRFQNATPC